MLTSPGESFSRALFFVVYEKETLFILIIFKANCQVDSSTDFSLRDSGSNPAGMNSV
jgi:hypothetical protein